MPPVEVEVVRTLSHDDVVRAAVWSKHVLFLLETPTPTTLPTSHVYMYQDDDDVQEHQHPTSC